MEKYSGNYVVESPQVEPRSEWGEETGLEDPMWRLTLGGGSQSFPERPGEVDCIYYLRTGLCGYGPRCRFNHPRDRVVALRDLRTGGGEYPERVGQPICQYYMRTGICKFGASCKYNHPKLRVGYSPAFDLNYNGYPLRQGEKECWYYMKTGECKFGVTCKFHHPEPISVQQMLPQQPCITSSPLVLGNWPVPRPTILPGPVIITPFPAPQITEPPPVGVIAQLSASATAYAGPYLSITSPERQKEHAFPKRPGQPECKYYLRTGDCKFRPTCKYHHPKLTNIELSQMGLPLRPGASLCSHYIQHGVCKFGPSCKFNHPLGYSASFTDMPVDPYHVGSTNATLAPSSSSSDLRHSDIISGAQVSSMNSSTASVGSMFSKSGTGN